MHVCCALNRLLRLYERGTTLSACKPVTLTVPGSGEHDPWQAVGSLLSSLQPAAPTKYLGCCEAEVHGTGSYSALSNEVHAS